jgi:hypothetical protein
MSIWTDDSGNTFDDGVPNEAVREVARAYFGHDAFTYAGPSTVVEAEEAGDPEMDHAVIPLAALVAIGSDAVDAG